MIHSIHIYPQIIIFLICGNLRIKEAVGMPGYAVPRMGKPTPIGRFVIAQLPVFAIHGTWIPAIPAGMMW